MSLRDKGYYIFVHNKKLGQSKYNGNLFPIHPSRKRFQKEIQPTPAYYDIHDIMI